ncbi:MAG: hypothetical protein ACHQX3_02330, partial [Nitrospirales bacterium]
VGLYLLTTGGHGITGKGGIVRPMLSRLFFSVLSHFLYPLPSLGYNQFLLIAGLVVDNRSRSSNEEST